MNNWFGNLKRHWQHAQVKRAVARLTLVAFGKHPAWDDHMDDIGLDTDFLVAAKRLLYIRGIRENIETGTWATLEENGSAIPFGHRFVWRHEQQILAGGLWSSRDGRGRQNYPLFLCTYLQTSLPAWLGLSLVPAVAALEPTCLCLSGPEEVQRYIQEQQETLRRTLASACVQSHNQEPGAALTHLARSMDTSSLLRILYHISREAGVSLEHRGVNPERSLMVRIPMSTTPIPLYPYWWFAFLQSWFSAGTILALFKPDGESWIDVFIGEPLASHVFALRAQTEAVPLASTIPYNIPAEFETAFRKIADL